MRRTLLIGLPLLAAAVLAVLGLIGRRVLREEERARRDGRDGPAAGIPTAPGGAFVPPHPPV